MSNEPIYSTTWHTLLHTAPHNIDAHYVLDAVIRSVVIDLIQNYMRHDPAFVSLIEYRISQFTAEQAAEDGMLP